MINPINGQGDAPPNKGHKNSFIIQSITLDYYFQRWLSDSDIFHIIISWVPHDGRVEIYPLQNWIARFIQETQPLLFSGYSLTHIQIRGVENSLRKLT